MLPDYTLRQVCAVVVNLPRILDKRFTILSSRRGFSLVSKPLESQAESFVLCVDCSCTDHRLYIGTVARLRNKERDTVSRKCKIYFCSNYVFNTDVSALNEYFSHEKLRAKNGTSCIIRLAVWKKKTCSKIHFLLKHQLQSQPQESNVPFNMNTVLITI